MSKGDKRDLGFGSDSSSSGSSDTAPKRKQRRSKPLLLPVGSLERDPNQRRTKEAEQLSSTDDYIHMKLPVDHVTNEVPLFGAKQDELDEDDNEVANNLPKGFNIMKKLGYKLGKKLGASNNPNSGLAEPLKLRGQTDRQGLRERVRVREDAHNPNMDSDRYREWRTGEDTKRQKERDLQNMQKLAFEMSGDVDRVTKDSDPRQFNVLWRRYVITLRQKYILHSTNEEFQEEQDLYENGYEGGDEQGLSDGRSDEAPVVPPNLALSETKSDLESPTSTDEELRMFEELSVDERIAMLHNLLRVEMRYCYYCGSKYADDQDLYVHCPGFQKEDHH